MAFLLALAPHELQLSGSLEDVSPCFQCGKMVPGSRGGRANLIYKLFCMFCLGLSEGLMQGTYLYFT